MFEPHDYLSCAIVPSYQVSYAFCELCSVLTGQDWHAERNILHQTSAPRRPQLRTWMVATTALRNTKGVLDNVWIVCKHPLFTSLTTLSEPLLHHPKRICGHTGWDPNRLIQPWIMEQLSCSNTPFLRLEVLAPPLTERCLLPRRSVTIGLGRPCSSTYRALLGEHTHLQSRGFLFH